MVYCSVRWCCLQLLPTSWICHSCLVWVLTSYLLCCKRCSIDLRMSASCDACLSRTSLPDIVVMLLPTYCLVWSYDLTWVRWKWSVSACNVMFALMWNIITLCAWLWHGIRSLSVPGWISFIFRWSWVWRVSHSYLSYLHMTHVCHYGARMWRQLLVVSL